MRRESSLSPFYTSPPPPPPKPSSFIITNPFCFDTKCCNNNHQYQEQECLKQDRNYLLLASPRCCLSAPSSTRWPADYFYLPHLSPASLMMSGPVGSNSPFDLPQEIRKKKLNGRQKREELEREVSMLQKILDQEEQTREILELVKNKHDGSAISIPKFFPPKMKKLLAELAMVEGEISRLETQITQLQNNLKQEQESTNEAKSRQWQNGNYHQINTPQPQQKHQSHSDFPPRSPMINKGMNNDEKVAFDTKALHFISKAIKGDYVVGSFSTVNEKPGTNLGVTGEKENHRLLQENKFQERINAKKSGVIKQASPLREARYSSPKTRERISLGTSLDLPPKSLSSTILLSEEGQIAQHWHPNKLSEDIMKCLQFIYIRLLRTTRAMELEKSGPISRSASFSLSSRNLRVDPISSNSRSMNLGSYKESRQQDPYGVFDVDESLPRDIGPYKNLVIFTSSSMDPKCISSSSSVSLIRKLRVLMSNLQTVDLRVLNYQQKLAFWINMYNACIMHFLDYFNPHRKPTLQSFLQQGAPNNPEKMNGLLNKATLNVGGNAVNAQAIEHYILRKPAVSFNMTEAYQKGDKEDKETVIRKLYGLDSTNPNITFALSCGTRSSPAVRIYTAENVTWELEKSKLEYLQASIVVTNSKRIGLPELLVRQKSDFVAARDLDSLVEWVCQQLPTSGSLRKSMVDCFRSSHHKLISSQPIVDKVPYDSEFQYLLAI